MCVFCEIIAGNIPGSKVYEDDDVLAILDLSQVTRGHTLVMPKKHYANLIEAQLVKNTGASGLNVLNNCGAVAGQSVEHLHFHLIPRYSENDAISIVFNESEKQDLDEVLHQVTGK